MSARTGMAETRRRALIGAALREISDHGSLDVTVAQIATAPASPRRWRTTTSAPRTT